MQSVNCEGVVSAKTEMLFIIMKYMNFFVTSERSSSKERKLNKMMRH